MTIRSKIQRYICFFIVNLERREGTVYSVTMDYGDGEEERAIEKEQKGGYLMGRRMSYRGGGAFGCIYDVANDNVRGQPSRAHLLVKQLGYEDDGGEELVREYRIANFLAANVPSFVACPFGLMRGVDKSPYFEEKLSLIQQPIYGKTFTEIQRGDFTTAELCSMFLQCSEFFLRVGGSLIMGDVNTGNAMVDIRATDAPRVKFIDFGCWFDKKSTTNITDTLSFDIMMSNIYFNGDPMKRLFFLMGVQDEEDCFKHLYDSKGLGDRIDVLQALPSRITDLFRQILVHGHFVQVIQSPQFSVVGELCRLRCDQKSKGHPIDVISEFHVKSTSSFGLT